MSVKVMGLVWEADLPQNLKLVLLAYSDFANHDGENVYPSISLVAWMTGYSERQVQRVTKELVTSGYLVSQGTSDIDTNLYRVNIDNLPIRERPKLRSRKTGRGDKLSPLEGGHGVTSETVGGDIAMSPDPSVLDPSDLILAQPSVEPSDREEEEPAKNKLTFKERMVLLSEKNLSDLKIRENKEGQPNRNDIVELLAVRFSRFTGIRLTLVRSAAEYGELWKAPLLRMYDAADQDIGRLAQVMTTVVKDMRENGLDIFSPKSVEKKFVSYCAANQPEPTVPAVQVPEGW